MDDERRARIALLALPGIGLRRFRRILEVAGSAAAFVADPDAWSRRAFRKPWPPSAADFAALADEQLALARSSGARPLLRGLDAEYPACFEDLPEPPPILFLRGRTTPCGDAATRVAIVGARACTAYGRAQAERFGCGLAAAGIAVVSGAARGIDQAAMRGALGAGGAVVAVLGSGIDRPYPREAHALLDAIVDQGGAVLSEFPCGADPARGNFPRRNRLIAALGQALLVVQAAPRSGTRETYERADELGRQLFALPGPVDSILSAGPHAMIRQQAEAVCAPEEIVEALMSWRALAEHYADGGNEPPVLHALALGDRRLADLAAELSVDPGVLRSELLDLELRGVVTRLPGEVYHRTGPRGDAPPESPCASSS